MLSPILRAHDHCSALVRRLHQCRQRGELLDCSIRVDTMDGDTKHILVHKIIIHCSSNILKDLPCDMIRKVGLQEVNLNLKSIDEVNCLEALISFMYTGSLETTNCEPNILKRLAMLYGIHGVLNLMQLPEQDTLSVIHSSDLHIPTVTSPAVVKEWTQRVVQSMQWTYGNLLFPNGRMFSHVSTEVIEKNRRRNQHAFDSASQLQTFIDEPAASCTAEQMELWRQPIRRAVSNNAGEQKSEVIIPSSDREGWCRNKKYIERVPSGYMCTVCQKVYGRYNSVSYHVTIYHRNPPIRCDEEGCKFSTREARYIHFHKFYRHHVPLPENIDLGSRKCVLCRHISKSPAMLEKHISRHLQCYTKTGQNYQCPQCKKQTNSQQEMLDHIVVHTEPEEPSFPCSHCRYRGQTERSLQQHVLFKHTSDMFSRKFTCTHCSYASTDSVNLATHYKKMHPQHQHQLK
ncbi:Zinc finger, C2H2 type family protein [Brugia malayi]|uniref:Zinc finger, C2H2 type family protein n=2 Tax=Brugia malayi TaxID=6279 RepID=A0A4E9F7M6_BRUMA|nr:Zinc finger, C2H2 type family protein [Brugia malayi]VIO92820.1 Zinc finger, C2H2 type family protein [Brugia malayi]